MTPVVTLTGDWGNISRSVSGLNAVMTQAIRKSLSTWARHAKSTAVGHLQFQDLTYSGISGVANTPWQPLARHTIESKIYSGLHSGTLVETGNYMANVKSVITMPNTAFVGVKFDAPRSPMYGRLSLVDIAYIHEYGVMELNIPPRPLWEPTFIETMDWWGDSEERVDRIFWDLWMKRIGGRFK